MVTDEDHPGRENLMGSNARSPPSDAHNALAMLVAAIDQRLSCIDEVLAVEGQVRRDYAVWFSRLAGTSGRSKAMK